MGKWIDISDRLPDACQMVLVSYPTYSDDDGNEYVESVGIAYLLTMGTNKYWCRSDGTSFGELGFATVEPVAWMPLPNPFKVRYDHELQT